MEKEPTKEPIIEAKEREEVQESAPEKTHKEGVEKVEGRESLTEEEKAIKEKLKKEVEMLKLNPQAQDDAQKKARQIKDLGAEGKLKKLFSVAEEKGLSFAVQVAKDMKDPYILDVFHDLLAKDEYYKKFEK